MPSSPPPSPEPSPPLPGPSSVIPDALVEKVAKALRDNHATKKYPVPWSDDAITALEAIGILKVIEALRLGLAECPAPTYRAETNDEIRVLKAREAITDALFLLERGHP